MVVTSLLVQGWTIKPAARWLRLIVPSGIGALERIELELPGDTRHELVAYRVLEESPLTSGISLPRWARPSLVVRGGRSIPFEEAQGLRAGDLVYLFAPPEYVTLLDRLFAQPTRPEFSDKEFFGHFMVNPDGLLDDLLQAYDLQRLEDWVPEQRIADFMRSELGAHPVVGDRVAVGPLDLVVRRVHQGREITEIGLSLQRQPRKSAYVRHRPSPRRGLAARIGALVGRLRR